MVQTQNSYKKYCHLSGGLNDSQSIDDISAYDNHIESCGNREWLSSVTVTGHVSRHDLAGGRWPSVYVVETILLKNGLILPKNHTRTNPKTNMATKVLSQVACEKKKHWPSSCLVFWLGSSQTFPVCYWSFNASYNCSGSNFATNQMTKEQTWTPYKHRFSIWFIPNKIQLLGRYPISQFEVPRHPHRLRWKSVQFPPGPVEELCWWASLVKLSCFKSKTKLENRD